MQRADGMLRARVQYVLLQNNIKYSEVWRVSGFSRLVQSDRCSAVLLLATRFHATVATSVAGFRRPWVRPQVALFAQLLKTPHAII